MQPAVCKRVLYTLHIAICIEDELLSRPSLLSKWRGLPGSAPRLPREVVGLDGGHVPRVPAEDAQILA